VGHLDAPKEAGAHRQR